MRPPYRLRPSLVFVKAPALIAAALLALIALSACGGKSPSATPSPSSTAAGTATGPASPSVSATPAATLTLPATTTHTATASVPPTATQAPPTPTPGPGGGRLIAYGNRDSSLVALTFDMGGRVDPALDIINYLVANQVPATIFITGAMVENENTDAGRQVLGIVAAHPELFRLGNHSYTHPSFTELSPAMMREELARTEAAIARYVSISPRPYFRPPNGAYNATVVSTVAGAGYPDTIYWDIDTIDWKPESDGGPTVDEIVAKVSERALGGSIVLMHLGGYNTYEALPRILSALQSKGLQPTAMHDVLGR